MGVALLGYAEGATCEMPWEWRLHVLEERARQRFGESVAVVVEDVYSMARDDAGSLMSEVYSLGREFPVVHVDGTPVCHGGIDLDAVLAALAEVRAAHGETGPDAPVARADGFGEASDNCEEMVR